ncbi:hypothetical protein IP90_03130 [Luteimonas cucumeris]|uniref:Uncharacterized protein n=1 Tax=Luteimonas cucumeris TaxID=985012 RepID=A0A562KVE8_9GAMM|nr:hypothetical protein [Luteimonas cucumeris]TWH99391.1 hypothetical protein IP90_03130 [Luteimonas cucumeris]
MSSITPDPLNRAGLDSLGGQVSLDDLRRQQGLDGGATGVAEAEVAYAPLADSPAAIDAGEAVLDAPAWADVPEGARLLAGDLAFEHDLGTMALSDAADLGADAVIAAFA